MNEQDLHYLKTEIQKLDFIKSPLRLKKVEKQKSHEHCVLCGSKAPLGLKLDFYHDQEQIVWAKAKGGIHQQGYQGILHGGFIAALLDCGMCHAVFHQGEEAVTADINIRYLKEIPLGAEILVRAQISKSVLTLYKVEAELYVKKKLMAKSSARFMKRR